MEDRHRDAGLTADARTRLGPVKLIAPLADMRARTTYLVQIGNISMQTKEHASLRMKRIGDYVEAFTGQVPEQRELDRFYARRGYKPR